jgi:hypothetical protein
MKGLGIILTAALLAIAPSYASAQQPVEKGRFPTGQPAPAGKFPTGQPEEQGKFPTEQPAPEGKFPAEQPTEQVQSPMERPAESGKPQETQTKGQEVKGGQAQPVKKYTPKEKKAYLKKTAADLAALQKRIDALKVKKEQDIPQRKRANRMIVVDLQKKALNARNKLATLEKAPDMAWSGLKAEMDKAMGDVQKAYSNALEYFEQ